MYDPRHPGTRKTLLNVYHSMTGGTRQMLEAARDAASEPTVRVRHQVGDRSQREQDQVGEALDDHGCHLDEVGVAALKALLRQ